MTQEPAITTTDALRLPTCIHYGIPMRPIFLTVFLLAFPAAAMAEDAAHFSDAFKEFCLSDGPHFNKTVDAAKGSGWTPLAADMAMGFTPVSDPIEIQGWLIGDGEESHFEALVGFRAKVAEKSVEGCTAAISGVDGKAVEKSIVAAVKAKSVGEEQGQDTTYKRFSTAIDGRDVALTISMPRYPNGSDQIVISLVAEEIMEN